MSSFQVELSPRFFLLAGLLGSTFLGCTRPEEISTRVSIQTPISYEAAEPPRRLQMSGSGEGESTWLGSISSRSEINCYMLFVGGPSASSKGNYCNARNSSTRVADFGPLVGGVPAGQKLEIDLPSGRDRVFYLFGMKSNQGSCKSFTPNGPDQQLISYPRLLQKVSANLQGNTQIVPMSVPLDLSNLTEIDKCEVRSIGGGSVGPTLENLTQYFGDKRDGDLNFSASDTGTLINGNSIILTFGAHSPFSGSPITGSKKFAAARKITDIGALGKSLTLDSNFVQNEFETGDEVLVHVTASHGTGVSGTGPDGGCGAQDLYAGAFRFRRIVSVGTNTMILDQSVSSTPASINRDLLNVTTSPRGGNSGTNFCSMQVVRVPSFQNVSITGGNTVTVSLGSAFSVGSGGILALRIRNLNLQAASAGLTIDASFSGFSKGPGNSNSGVGFGGIITNTSTWGITNAGGVVVTSRAAGGAGFGHGADADAARPSGGRAPDSCSQGSKCELFRHQRAIPGGGGGSDLSNYGGNGGGVLLLFVEQITGNGTLELKANGQTAATAGGGGGGGGRILLISRSMNLPTAKFRMEAKGGGSQPNNGVGGGGEIEVRICQSQSNPIDAANLLVPLGTGGSVLNAEIGRREVVNVPLYCL
ncbi:MAG: hypothetical protein WCH11_00830 [Bdellovibrio sp.]